MLVYNTNKSISYQLMMKDDPFIVWCVMLLFRAHLLTGQSGFLINPIVRLVQTRKQVKKHSIVTARKMLREYHTVDLAVLTNKEG